MLNYTIHISPQAEEKFHPSQTLFRKWCERKLFMNLTLIFKHLNFQILGIWPWICSNLGVINCFSSQLWSKKLDGAIAEKLDPSIKIGFKWLFLYFAPFGKYICMYILLESHWKFHVKILLFFLQTVQVRKSFGFNSQDLHICEIREMDFFRS